MLEEEPAESYLTGGRAAKHRGSVRASHPADLGLIPGVSEGFFLSMSPRFIDRTALLRIISGQRKRFIMVINTTKILLQLFNLNFC